ncbi:MULTISPECIES: DUF3108 domain-containing protein [Acinetobacter Taxon 24D]|jgi:hypothetical protein|uniref:DUF3108 domain-containing protein n=1 Tax=Acinetobacter Taxon 24D TaxID=2839057 RepID=UPI00103D66C9|nr:MULTISPECIES: DUF3108 domain-containing protein [Acinetobacter Taxon 24D]NNG83235.1 DUF3108 domain-containing protein [Acinetobacter sp. ANC 5378]TCH63214.1 DUF3108 domain-containing protein [Acinetobacter sp. ANC 4862]
MAHNVLKTIALASGVSTTLLFAGFSSQAFAMSPFQASYQFSYNGKNMGSATRTLSKSGNNWTYVFAAKAGAIASATETSHFSFNGNNIISNNFSRSSKILIHNNTMSINFNPNAKTINTKKDDKARSFAWKSGVLDELNAELQLREDLKASGLKSSYAIADAKEVESRRFVKQGTEKVKTSYGTFDTIKVVMKHDKPNRDTIFWLAPKLDYVPVKVSHQDGKTSYGLLLTGYKGLTN